MEPVNRKSDKSLISIIRQTGLLSILIFFLSALANPISVLTEETSQANSTFLQGKLNTAREYGTSGSYKLTESLIAQANSGEYYEEAQELKPKLSGAGGYYGDKDWQTVFTDR
jgi:hypothetical protein